MTDIFISQQNAEVVCKKDINPALQISQQWIEVVMSRPKQTSWDFLLMAV